MTACGLKGRSFPRQYGRIVMRLVPTYAMIDPSCVQSDKLGLNVIFRIAVSVDSEHFFGLLNIAL